MNRWIMKLNKIYSFTYVPVYYFRNGAADFSFPAEALPYLPPQHYLEDFKNGGVPCAYLTTSFYCLYGYIYLGKRDFLIYGPISTVPYSHTIIREMRRDLLIPESDNEDFMSFLQGIPRMTLKNFTDFLSYIYFTLRDTEMEAINLSLPSSEIREEKISQTYISKQFEDHEYEFYNNSLEVERAFLRCVEKGDSSRLQRLITQPRLLKTGTLADNNLRQVKTGCIVMIALSARAAIKGGLPADTAFHLSDSYIQQMENVSSPADAENLCARMMVDYTSRVAGSILPAKDNIILQKVIQYVHENTNRHITVTDIARHVGYSRAYLSHKFKETLGFDLNAFIRRCKLEEAKELLRYTNKSIGEISNYLCFSSQSYFQNCFKAQYHITPQGYRHGHESRHS